MHPLFDLQASVYLTAIGMPRETKMKPHGDHGFPSPEDIGKEKTSLFARITSRLKTLNAFLREHAISRGNTYGADYWFGP